MAEVKYQIGGVEYVPVSFGEMTLLQANWVQQIVDEALPLLDFEEGMRVQDLLGQVFSEGRIAARLTAAILRPAGGSWAVPSDDMIGLVEAEITLNQVREILTGFFLPAVESLTAFRISSDLIDRLEHLGAKFGANGGSESRSQSAEETPGDTGS